MESEKIFCQEKQKKDEELKNLLLEGPELVSSEEEEKRKNKIGFCFSYDETKYYYFSYKNGKPFFIIEYYDSLPEKLSEEEKEKFTKEIRKQDGIEKTVYVLEYGEVPESEEDAEEIDSNQDREYRIAQPRDFEKGVIDRFVADDANKQIMSEILLEHSTFKPEEISQIVEQIFKTSSQQDSGIVANFANRFSKETTEKIRAEIRERMLPKPQEIEIAQLVEILKSKKVLFYTGAGISMASGIYNMKQLQEALEIEMAEKTDDFLKKAIINPQGIINIWEEFIKAAFEKPTTPAHQSLARLAQKLNSQIFTENIDDLQEKTGIKAIHLNGTWLKENVEPEWLKDIDVVITIGLSYDDRGFLNWYKENNPAGKIIAVNLNQPPYLSNEDFLLKGDCQELICELEKELAGQR